MKRLAYLLIPAVLCIFAVAGHAAVLLDRVVAVVNKEVITWSELYRMMQSEASEKLATLDEDGRARVFRENEPLFLQKLIDIRLQIQEARRLGVDISAADVNEAIENIKKKYGLSDGEFKDSIEKEGLKFEEYKEKLSEQILVNRLINQRIRNKVIVSEEDVKKFVEMKKTGVGEESYRIGQIFLRKPQEPFDAKAMEEKAASIMQKLSAGKEFETLAREYSEDYSSRSGGDLGYVKKSQMAGEFMKVISSMQPGEVSNAFWTGNGIHIVKLYEKAGEQYLPEVMENARKALTEERFTEKYKDFVKGLRERARIEVRL